MCVIMYKPTGIQPPSSAIIDNCFDANPDGAGLAIIRPSSTATDIYKGFMSLDSFKDFASAIVTEDDAVGYHFRITTAGGTSPQNCHPFPISTYPEDLKKLSVHSRFALLHNGILGKGDDKLKLSDTQLYIKNVLAPRYPQSIAAERAAIEKETKGSRVLLMDGRTHETAMIGDGWVKSDGLWFSNHSFEDPLPRYAYSWWKDDRDARAEDMYDMICPYCNGEAEPISYQHDLWECLNCGALMDSEGNELMLSRMNEWEVDGGDDK